MALDGKRLPKKEAIASIVANYEIVLADIPGLDDEAVAGIIDNSGQYVFQSEIEDIVTAQKEKSEDFDAERFVTILEAANAVKKTKATNRSGSTLTRIDSEERALEVANDPTDAPKIQELMAKMIELRKEIAPLIDKHASVSIALKNKKVVDPAEDVKVKDFSAEGEAFPEQTDEAVAESSFDEAVGANEFE